MKYLIISMMLLGGFSAYADQCSECQSIEAAECDAKLQLAIERENVGDPFSAERMRNYKAYCYGQINSICVRDCGSENAINQSPVACPEGMYGQTNTFTGKLECVYDKNYFAQPSDDTGRESIDNSFAGPGVGDSNLKKDAEQADAEAKRIEEAKKAAEAQAAQNQPTPKTAEQIAAEEKVAKDAAAKEELDNLAAVANDKAGDNGVWGKKYKDSCEPKRQRAEVCCGDSPASCLKESFGTDEAKSNLGVQALNALAQGSMGMSDSIGQLCGRMKTVAQGATAINVALGATCARKVYLCKVSCGDFKKEMVAEKEKLEASAASTGGLSAGQIMPLKALIAKADDAIDTCKKADNATVRAGMAAFASFQAAKASDLCKSQASSSGGVENIATNAFDVDCGAAGAAANPICQAQCQRPGAENDPICVSILQNLNGGANTAVNFRGGDGTEDDSFDVGDISEEDQQFNAGDNPAASNSVASVAPGGGGGPNGGGPGGGGGGDGAAGGPAGAGKSKSILRGTSSGNGYTRSAMRTGARGGYRGPASGSSRGAYKKGKKFSLKDFLPGGKANPKRGLAGFSKRNPQIGAKSDNLFNKISARFYEICLKDRLYDCKTITNRKRGR